MRKKSLAVLILLLSFFLLYCSTTADNKIKENQPTKAHEEKVEVTPPPAPLVLEDLSLLSEEELEHMLKKYLQGQKSPFHDEFNDISMRCKVRILRMEETLREPRFTSCKSNLDCRIIPGDACFRCFTSVNNYGYDSWGVEGVQITYNCIPQPCPYLDSCAFFGYAEESICVDGQCQMAPEKESPLKRPGYKPEGLSPYSPQI